MRNILFITMDQLRKDALGFEGVFPVKTPVIDELAAKGTVFDNTYCTNPLCVPARASIMTGKYSCQIGNYYNDQNWDDSLPTLPGELSKNGYFTISVGKMHFRPGRKYYGFDKRVADNDTDYKLYLQRNNIKPDKPSGTSWEELVKHSFGTKPTNIPMEHYLPTYITRTGLHELDLLAQRRECKPGGNEPFFMWLSYLLPHTPVNPPEPYFSMYAPEDVPPPVRSESEQARYSNQLKYWRDQWVFCDDEWTAKIRAQYLGCITLIDDQLNKIIAKLKELDLYDNTLIVLSSDHGDYMGDHYMMQKSFFHDCSAKVPLIFCGPDIPAGLKINELANHADLMPTLLDYCGLIYRPHDDGTQTDYDDGTGTGITDNISLLPWISNGQGDGERAMLCESGIGGLSIMVRRKNLKINYYDDTGEIDFFDLEKDPGELNNDHKRFSSIEELPAEFREDLQEVLKTLEEHRSKQYFFKGRLRPMFT